MLLGLALVFGSGFSLVKLVLASYGPLTVALLRVSLGAVILGAVTALRGRTLPRGRRIWLSLLVMGALNNAIPFGLICWSQTHIDSGLAAIDGRVVAWVARATSPRVAVTSGSPRDSRRS